MFIPQFVAEYQQYRVVYQEQLLHLSAAAKWGKVLRRKLRPDMSKAITCKLYRPTYINFQKCKDLYL